LSLLKSQVPDFHFASFRNLAVGRTQQECQDLEVGGWFDCGKESGPAFTVSSDDVSPAFAILFSLDSTRGLFSLPIHSPHLPLAFVEGFHVPCLYPKPAHLPSQANTLPAGRPPLTLAALRAA
jgi:hypothetical protein